MRKPDRTGAAVCRLGVFAHSSSVESRRRWHFGYDRGMPVSVNIETVHPRKLAAVRREVAPGAVSSAWGPAVGKVWEFIRSQPGLWTGGHNIFVYHHPNQ